MRMKLKIAIVAAGIKHQDLAIKANRLLMPAHHLSELDITKIVTNRKAPTPEQQTALASVLGMPSSELFHPEVLA